MSMNILAPLTLTNAECGDIPCGACPPCLRRVMLKAAEYALRTENPAGTLRALLEDLGLAQQREVSGRNR